MKRSSWMSAHNPECHGCLESREVSKAAVQSTEGLVPIGERHPCPQIVPEPCHGFTTSIGIK